MICAENVDWYVTTLDKSEVWSYYGKQNINQGNSNENIIVNIDEMKRYQKIYGYGAALTQSSAYLLTQLKMHSNTQYNALLDRIYNISLHNRDSLGIKVLRLPITSNDFILASNEYYTYDDSVGDYNLTHESLKNDENYIIPVLKDILQVNPDLKIIACPWSAPVWMKTRYFYDLVF